MMTSSFPAKSCSGAPCGRAPFMEPLEGGPAVRVTAFSGLAGTLRRRWSSSAAAVLALLGCLGCVRGEDPPEGALQEKKLKEVSGMVASAVVAGHFWVHNDGDAKRLYAVDGSGQEVNDLSLKDLDVVDLEDIARGPGPEAGVSYLYLGDIGDNAGVRDRLNLFRLKEPDPRQKLKRSAVEVETFHLRYPDGRHDAEALLVDPLSGDVVVVTKGKVTRVYAATQDQLAPGGTVTLAPVKGLPVVKVSAGDISSDGSKILLRNETHAWLWERGSGEALAQALSRSPKAAKVVGPPEEPNGEAIAFDLDGSGYFTLSEGAHPMIYQFSLNPQS